MKISESMDGADLAALGHATIFVLPAAFLQMGCTCQEDTRCIPRCSGEAMSRPENSEYHYGLVAILLHWIMAALLIVLILLGVYMVSLPDVGFNTTKISLILVHKQLGILALFLVAVRTAWRSANTLPMMAEQIPAWQQFAARFVHLLLYALMFALPTTGWLMSSAAGIPVEFFGLFTLPDYIARDELLFRAFITLHRWLAYGLVLLLSLHAGAALAHHFLLRDDTLKRMLPNGEDGCEDHENPGMAGGKTAQH
jgi:cytochrome b561